MATRSGFTPTITDVPFDPEIVADNIQYLPQDKNSLAQAGVTFIDPRFVQVAGQNTGKITIPAYTFDENDTDEEWTGDVDGSTSKLPNNSQTSVVVSRFKAWEWNDLALVISNGVQPNQAVLNYIQSFRDKQQFGIIKSVLKGMFADTTIGDKLVYDMSTKPAKTYDFMKARAKFWGDRADETPVFYIMHSVVYTALMTQLTETTMKNFLKGAEIVVDDKITDGGSGIYSTYIFRRNAIATSGDLAGSKSFTERSELLKQGTEVLGYKRRLIISPVGVTFKGNIVKATGANVKELETGTNWGLLDIEDAHRYVRVGILKSKESIDPEQAMEMVAEQVSPASAKSISGSKG